MREYRDHYDYDLGPMKHSRLGIASFMLAIGTGLMMAVLVVFAAAIDASQPGALDAHTPSGKLLVGGLCFASLLALTGVGLGIAGVSQTKRKTVYAILGLVFNGLIVLGGGCLGLLIFASEL
jgi:hypothetical protein